MVERQPFQREWEVSVHLYSNEDPEFWIKDYLKGNEEENVEVTSVYSRTTGCGRNVEEEEE